MFQVKIGMPEHGHARGAQVVDRRDQVDPGEYGRKARENERHDPEVGACPGGVDRIGEWGVGDPPEVGRRSRRQKAQHHQRPTAEVQPVRQSVQPREGHVRGTDLQRDDVVGEPTEGDRPDEQVDHQAAVHREHLVVGVLRQQSAVRVRQLRPDEHRHRARQEEEDDGGDRVVLADHLVVGRGDPLHEPRGAGASCSCAGPSSKTAGRSAISVMPPPPRRTGCSTRIWKAPGVTTRDTEEHLSVIQATVLSAVTGKDPGAGPA